MTRITLELEPGVVSDETTYATSAFYADASNVRFRYGKAETIGGWEAYTDDAVSGVCRTVLAWTDRLSQTNVAFGTTDGLFVIKNGILYDITPTGYLPGEIDSVTYEGGWGSGGWGMGGWGVGGTEVLARTWSLANYGEQLMASPSGGALYLWANDPTTPATIISQAPSAIARMIVTPQRQVLALGCPEEVSGVYNPMCIRGSDIEDYTDWTTSPDDNAFEHILEGGGRIIDAKVFGQSVIVWTDTSVFIGQYVGQANQTYRFDLMADNCGLAGSQASVIVNQTAYWLTPDLQFYALQYGGAPIRLPCPISRDFAGNIDTTQMEKIVAVSNSAFGEVWWFYPDSRDGDENSRYIAVSTEDYRWFPGDIARTAAIDSGPLAYPLAVDADGRSYFHEKGNSANGSALSWHIETGGQYVGKGERNALLRGIWPDFEAQQGVVYLTVKARDYPQGTDVTKGPFSLGPATRKVDFMMQGRIVSLRLSGESDPTFMRLGKPSFDVVATGSN